MKRFACMGLCVALAVPALAGAAAPPVEASMVLVGTITVNPDGSVKAYTVKDLDKLPPAVRQVVQVTVSQWQFNPITRDGKAITAETGMSMRIVADVSGKNATLRVAGAEFGCDSVASRSLALGYVCAPGTMLEPLKQRRPLYPLQAMLAHMGGEVYVVVDVDRAGRVTRAAARQVNLYSRARTPLGARVFREQFVRSALVTAHSWTFKIPTLGPEAGQNDWIVVVPVSYNVQGSGSGIRSYGQWKSYIPGPVNPVNWNETGADGTPRSDAMAAGGAFTRDTRFTLKTPPRGNGSRS